jgi:ubiquitin carboxyl-terminal hydrolase 5/13
MSSSSELLSLIRSELTYLRLPLPHDKVYNDECVISFDSPYSEHGIYLNLKTFYSYGEDYYQQNALKTNSKLYLHLLWRKIPSSSQDKKEMEQEGGGMEEQREEENPTILGIGVEGGFNPVPKFDILKTYALTVLTDTSGPVEIPLFRDSNEEDAHTNLQLPEYLLNICQGVIDHQGMKENLQLDTWTAEQEIIESKHALNLPQLSNGKKISNDPQSWRCEMSGDTANLWLNLSTGYIGGGRRQWDGTGGSGAALIHYEETGRIFPLCVKLGTITPHGADVWSYDPDEDCTSYPLPPT